MSFIFTYQNSYLDISNYMCIPLIIDISKIILLLKIQIDNQINYHFKHNLYFSPHIKGPFKYHIKSNISNNITNYLSINISSYSCHVIWHEIWSVLWYVWNEIYFLIRNLKCNHFLNYALICILENALKCNYFLNNALICNLSCSLICNQALIRALYWYISTYMSSHLYAMFC